MKRFVLIWLAAVLIAAPVSIAWSADLSDPEYRAEVAERFPGVSADDITPSAVEGLWEVSQKDVVGYISANGRYLLDGDLIDLERDVNLSARERRAWRLKRIGKVAESQMLVYAPSESEHTLTVFTDVECAYCRRLHQQIDKLLEAGIRVRYMFYPLAGPQSKAYQQAQAVWCSDDRKTAFLAALQDRPIPGEAGCGSPVEAHYRLAVESLGLRGTPTILTESGRILPPGIPVPELVDKVLAAKND